MALLDAGGSRRIRVVYPSSLPRLLMQYLWSEGRRCFYALPFVGKAVQASHLPLISSPSLIKYPKDATAWDQRLHGWNVTRKGGGGESSPPSCLPGMLQLGIFLLMGHLWHRRPVSKGSMAVTLLGEGSEMRTCLPALSQWCFTQKLGLAVVLIILAGACQPTQSQIWVHPNPILASRPWSIPVFCFVLFFTFLWSEQQWWPTVVTVAALQLHHAGTSDPLRKAFHRAAATSGQQ